MNICIKKHPLIKSRYFFLLIYFLLFLAHGYYELLTITQRRIRSKLMRKRKMLMKISTHLKTVRETCIPHTARTMTSTTTMMNQTRKKIKRNEVSKSIQKKTFFHNIYKLLKNSFFIKLYVLTCGFRVKFKISEKMISHSEYINRSQKAWKNDYIRVVIIFEYLLCQLFCFSCMFFFDMRGMNLLKEL